MKKETVLNRVIEWLKDREGPVSPDEVLVYIKREQTISALDNERDDT